MAEHMTFNHGVRSSILRWVTSTKGTDLVRAFCTVICFKIELCKLPISCSIYRSRMQLALSEARISILRWVTRTSLTRIISSRACFVYPFRRCDGRYLRWSLRFRLWFFPGFGFVSWSYTSRFYLAFRQGRGSIGREEIALILSEVCRCQRGVSIIFSLRKKYCMGIKKKPSATTWLSR